MQEKEIKELIGSLIEGSLAGQEIERYKVDCKAKWYNLKEEKEKYIFLKDATAIVNSTGDDGFIIVGYDEKNKEINEAFFKDSNLRDNSEITQLINRYVDGLFQVNILDLVLNGKNLNIIHIPRSINKPHVIRGFKSFKPDGSSKEEEHRIFTRIGTNNKIATKWDIEQMFFDNQKSIPEYECFIEIDKIRISLNTSSYQDTRSFWINIRAAISIENTGRRSFAVSFIRFVVAQRYDDDKIEKMEFIINLENIDVIRPQDILHKEYTGVTVQNLGSLNDANNLAHRFKSHQASSLYIASAELRSRGSLLIPCKFYRDYLPYRS